MPIDNPGQLRQHLELAIQVELTTVPPYLYAMYSIEDQTSEPALLIRSIVAEEMLHAALAANLLLAVGGRPDFSSTAYMPTYPSDVPHHKPPLRVDLAPCSLDLVHDLFMRIEQPEIHGAPDQPDEFETLGQFYHALEHGLETLNESHDLFSEPQTQYQMSDPAFYAPVVFDAEDSGGLVEVTDLDSAVEAIEIIVHQGEGLSDERWADPDHQELTHYYKLLRIYDGESPLGEVTPLRTNPKTLQYPEHVRPVSDLFNASYRYIYLIMHRLFSPGDKKSLVDDLYGLMISALAPLGRHLTSFELGDGTFAGPTFEVFDLGDSPEEKLAAMSESVAEESPQLTPVAEWFAART